MIDFNIRHMPWLLRVLLMWIVETMILFLLIFWFSTITLADWLPVLFVSLVIGLLNALVRPVLVYFSIVPKIWYYAGTTFVLDATLLWLVSQYLPELAPLALWPALIIALVMALVTNSFGDILAIDDDDSYYHHIVSDVVAFYGKPEKSDIPGILFLEIDGLSQSILQQALQDGYMPTLSRWLETGSHQLAGWECDLSSQTSASQAGILLGDNYDIPAFRWFEKEHGKQMVSNFPADTAEIERRLTTGNGLLANEGVSRSNLFSGDAPYNMFTFSTISDVHRHRAQDFYPLWMGGYNVLRMILLFIWDLISERRAAVYQHRHDIQPRMHRGGVYPLLRASTTVLLRELSLYILIGDMYAGVPVAYTTFFGYDEVAHHSGIAEPDTLDVLRGLDYTIERLEQFSQNAPRPYHFVILSDHGQSQGATFKQRYDLTLKDLTEQLIADQHTVESIESEDAGWGNLSVFLTELVNQIIPEDNQIASRITKRILKSRMYLDQVIIGPYREYMESKNTQKEQETADVVVLASGNLGLIYFTDWEERLSYEQINNAFPEIIQGLVQHEGISFIMVCSEVHGPLVIGAEGIHYLEDGRIEGTDPLAIFSPNAPDHLCRTNNFPHVADIMVNSLYDPETGEVAAFEELVGSHGGLGGGQSFPFVLFPANWQLDKSEIVGATQLHAQFKSWLDQYASEQIVERLLPAFET
jgi:uncharacterized membrane protein YvlD (DUF360 family)